MDLSNNEVQTKYRDAATVANAVLQQVIAGLAPGRKIADICEEGDRKIEEAVSKIYAKKKIEKGVAFPTCISVNETVGHFSPLKAESPELKAGDAVKIDLGVHIDGMCAMVAHTVLLGADGTAPVTGPQADVIAAAHQAAEVALRLIKPGNKNTAVTEAIEKVAEAYGVKAVGGVQSTQLKPFMLEAEKTIALRRDPEQRVDEVTFEANEVYAIDIAMTTGDGKPRASEARTTVYRRNVDVNYQLKLKASRWLVSEVNKRFPVLPFSIRALGDDVQARLGVTEAAKHGVVQAYPVLQERDGCFTAHFKFTALLLPGGTFKATGLDVPAYVASEKSLPADLAAVRAAPSFVKKVRGAAAAGGGGGDVDMKA